MSKPRTGGGVGGLWCQWLSTGGSGDDDGGSVVVKVAVAVGVIK